MRKSMLKKIGLLVIIVFILIIILYFLLKTSNNQVGINNTANIQGEEDRAYDSIGAKDNQVLNFLAYPNQQKFCPNIYNSS